MRLDSAIEKLKTEKSFEKELILDYHEICFCRRIMGRLSLLAKYR